MLLTAFNLLCANLFGVADPTPFTDTGASQISLKGTSCTLTSTNKEPCPFVRRGDDPLQNSIAAYNAPASLKLNQDCEWQGYGTLSWVYWHVSESGLDLATTQSFSTVSNPVVPLSTGSATVFQDFDYKKGFKLGLGTMFGEEGWILSLDWTRLYQSTKSSFSAPTLSGSSIGALSTTDWFYQTSNFNQSIASQFLHSKWHLHLNWLDLAVSRPFYQSPHITLHPFLSIRATCLQQNITIAATNILNLSTVSSTLYSYNRSDSWGIGPRAGLELHYLLGDGFRLEGGAGGSVLYTRYSKISHSEDSAATGMRVFQFLTSLDALRPMAEVRFGTGWGWYSFCGKWHLDFNASYEFNYLWGQNMIRAANDWSFKGVSGSAQDVSLHGLTLTAALTF